MVPQKITKVEFMRVQKFVVVGVSAAIVNLGSMALLVELLGFENYFLRNLANAMSMELSIVYAFMCNRLWTWHDAPRKKGTQLLWQLLLFHLAALTGALVRIGLFALLDFLGLYYLLNVTSGIGVAAVLDFVLYDRIVFKRRSTSLREAI